MNQENNPDNIRQNDKTGNKCDPNPTIKNQGNDKENGLNKKLDCVIKDIDDDDENLIQKSDYETASEFQPDFESDCEPPQDKIQEKKMVHKGKDYRIYKRILHLGREWFMPAKFDKVTYKYIKVESEEVDKEILSDIDFNVHQMGLSPELDDPMIFGIQSMKRGETAVFTIEHIRMNKIKHQRELVGYEYFLVELQTWTTIIDLFGDFSCMKKVNTRSLKKVRYIDSDEAQLIGKVYQSDKVLYDFTMKEAEVLTVEKHSELLIKFCEGMKQDEDVEITCKPEYIREAMEEDGHFFYKDADWTKDIIFDIKIEKIINIRDIKEDGTLLVKTMTHSYTSAQAEPHSKMYFDYKIYYRDTNELIYASTEKFERILPQNQETTELVESLEVKKYYIDEFELSRGMILCIKDMKKMEEVELHVTGSKYFKYGDDYEIVKNWLSKNKGIKKTPQDIRQKYIIKLYTFSQNINTFTMTFDEKIMQASKKKDLATKYMKEKAYKRAKKIFTIIKDLLQSNVKEKDEIERAKSLNISCLSNFALCCWKLEEWVAMDTTCDEILAIQVDNYKAFYRKMLANYMLQKYEFVEGTINDYLDEAREKASELNELHDLRKKNTADFKKHISKEKEIYKNMFA